MATNKSKRSRISIHWYIGMASAKKNAQTNGLRARKKKKLLLELRSVKSGFGASVYRRNRN